MIELWANFGTLRMGDKKGTLPWTCPKMDLSQVHFNKSWG